MHAAGLFVEVAQPGRQARHTPRPAEGALGGLDRLDQGVLEGDETAVAAAFRRQIE